MSILGCLVIQHAASDDQPGSWEVIVGDQSENLAPDVPPTELAVCAKLLAGMTDLKSIHVVIAPASTSCFFVKLHPSDDIDARDRSALTFELEDHLPIDAESMVADFVPIESPSGEAGAFGSLAIPVEPWRSVVEAFESADMPVRSIVPSAVLAARALSEGGDLAETVRWLLVDDGRCDCICIRNETILSWNHLSVDEPSLRRHLILDRLPIDRTVVVGADPPQLNVIRTAQPDVQAADASTRESVFHGTRLLMDNRSQRWFELRRDQLGPSDPFRAIGKQLRWVAVAAGLCFLALSVGGWWRASRIENEIAEVQERQAELFREAFPGSRVSAIMLRVRNEHKRVANSRGQNSDVEIHPSATMILRALLRSLPEDVRYHVQSIDINNGEVALDVLIKNREDAEPIVNAIMKGGFSVRPPNPSRSENDASKYNAVINATWLKPNASNRDSDGGSE